MVLLETRKGPCLETGHTDSPIVALREQLGDGHVLIPHKPAGVEECCCDTSGDNSFSVCVCVLVTWDHQ